jgi:hypothetical protein
MTQEFKYTKKITTMERNVNESDRDNVLWHCATLYLAFLLNFSRMAQLYVYNVILCLGDVKAETSIQNL